ncbi:BTAD domain-containing putative transcriptional regulator [Kitasatospora xanthocidica]|uniref:AfsR/SARP family transcriptional regulator n=1 Tax=Kitasatospora xanthocidica TaxID=83382 RepID=UPI0036E71132
MVSIRVLGSFAAEWNGGPVPLGGRRQRAVLARLAVARGAVVSVDRLVEEIWQGAPPARAVTSLQAYVSNLRRLLEPGRAPRTPATLLVSAPPGYALRLPDGAVDAWRFERLLREAREVPQGRPETARRLLGEALSLWRGTAYAEFVDDSWARAEVARLDELRLVARELNVVAGLRSADAAVTVPEAELLTVDEPLREEGWRLHALALWAAGRQADALATLRRARAVLAAEVGLDPGPALNELEAAVLGGRTEVLRAATEVPRHRPPTAARTPRSCTPKPPPRWPGRAPRTPAASCRPRWRRSGPLREGSASSSRRPGS